MLIRIKNRNNWVNDPAKARRLNNLLDFWAFVFWLFIFLREGRIFIRRSKNQVGNF
jgi:hypothetical protein